MCVCVSLWRGGVLCVCVWVCGVGGYCVCVCVCVCGVLGRHAVLSSGTGHVPGCAQCRVRPGRRAGRAKPAH